MTERLNQCDYPGCDAPRKAGARFCEGHLNLSIKAQEDYERLVNETLAQMMAEPEDETPLPHTDPYPYPVPSPNRGMPPIWARAPLPDGAPHACAPSQWRRRELRTLGAYRVPAFARANIVCSLPYEFGKAHLIRFRAYLARPLSFADYENLTLESIEHQGYGHMTTQAWCGIPLTHFIRLRRIAPIPMTPMRHSDVRFEVQNHDSMDPVVTIIGELGIL